MGSDWPVTGNLVPFIKPCPAWAYLIEKAVGTHTICSSWIAKSSEVGLDLAIQTEQDCMMFKYFLHMDIVLYTPSELENWKTANCGLVATVLREGKVLFESQS